MSQLNRVAPITSWNPGVNFFHACPQLFSSHSSRQRGSVSGSIIIIRLTVTRCFLGHPINWTQYRHPPRLYVDHLCNYYVLRSKNDILNVYKPRVFSFELFIGSIAVNNGWSPYSLEVNQQVANQTEEWTVWIIPWDLLKAACSAALCRGLIETGLMCPPVSDKTRGVAASTVAASASLPGNEALWNSCAVGRWSSSKDRP